MREVSADAPGRVNLIGEHTDYHDGFVMPCAVPQRTFAQLRTRDDGRVRAESTGMPGRVEYELGHEHAAGTWGDYVQGLTWALASAGYRVGGFDLRVGSDVPVGSGLSSSAALEIAILRALRDAFGLPISDIDLARLGRQAEVAFVGAPVGIMDQMACSLAGQREALFLDTRTLEFERIPLPQALELVVIDSGLTHQHAGGGYVTRRRESAEAARLLGVERLRDVGPDDLERLDSLPAVLARRARHVITENARVLDAREALRTGDLAALGRLFHASHASLRDDYDVSVPLVDLLVDLASALPSVFGARMTGGGFGGSIVAAAAAGTGRDTARTVVSAFRERTGRVAKAVIPVEA